MGIVIFTADDARYKTGNYLTMYGEMTSPPTAPNTTYIYHTKRFTEKEVLYWAPVIPYRMVVVVDKMPSLSPATQHCVIIDQSLKAARSQFPRLMRAALCWADRDRAAKALGEVPLPVANAYIKANTNDIELGRSLARARYTVHDDYLRAIIVYGMEPVRNFEHPSGTIKLNHYILPDGMRQSDKHWETIASADVPLKNEIRRNQPESLLKGVKKTPESVNEWL